MKMQGRHKKLFLGSLQAFQAIKKPYCVDKMTIIQYFFFGFDDSKLVNFVELIQLKL